jgi:hypothetical protein
MPIQSPRWPYTQTLVDQAPDEWGGVYVLWAGDQLVHIGHAPDCGPTLKSALREHLIGRCSVCTGKATHYAWELSQQPEKRERELLEEFRAQHGGLPACNAQKPKKTATGPDKRRRS